MSKLTELYGLILAGGKSSRMGFDKRLIEIANITQQEYLSELLKQYCKKVFLSCKNSNRIPERFNPLVDLYDLDSPLNGILSAFKNHPDKAWLIVAVDMPMITGKSIETLIANRDSSTLATSYLDSDDKLPEPLFSLWEPSAALPLQDFYNKGNRSPRLFLQQNTVTLISSADKNILTNVNTHEDLKKITWRK